MLWVAATLPLLIACGTATPNIVVSFTPASIIAEGQGSLGRPTGLADDLPPPLIHGLAADMTPEPWTPTITPSSGGQGSLGRPAGLADDLPPRLTVTATPVAVTATVSAASYGTTLTEAQMDALLAEVSWPVETREAAKRVALCESGWRPGATGAAGEKGLWQTMPRFHQAKADAIFGPGANLYDPVVNASVALVISGGGRSWAAWTCKPW